MAFLDGGDLGADALEHPVGGRVVAVHGRHALAGLLGPVAAQVREQAVGLLRHLSHQSPELLEVFEQSPGLGVLGVRPQFLLELPQMVLEQPHRRLEPCFLGGDLVRLEDVVARGVDAGGQLAEPRALVQAFGPGLVVGHGPDIDLHIPVGQDQAQRHGEEREGHQQVEDVVPAGRRRAVRLEKH